MRPGDVTTTLVGLDGCRGGWVALAQTGDAVVAHFLATLDELDALSPCVAAIDIPIGLPDAGPRPCDTLARRALGRPRGSSVFPVPVRSVLGAATYAEACRLNRAADGRGISRQAWNLVPKIREADAYLRARPGSQTWLRESHPELAFARWAGHAMRFNKKSAAGRAERLRLVEARFGVGALAAARRALPARVAAADDVLDAFALLRTAARLAVGVAESLPGEPPCDGVGLRAEIVA